MSTRSTTGWCAVTPAPTKTPTDVLANKEKRKPPAAAARQTDAERTVPRELRDVVRAPGPVLDRGRHGGRGRGRGERSRRRRVLALRWLPTGALVLLAAGWSAMELCTVQQATPALRQAVDGTQQAVLDQDWKAVRQHADDLDRESRRADEAARSLTGDDVTTYRVVVSWYLPPGKGVRSLEQDGATQAFAAGRDRGWSVVTSTVDVRRGAQVTLDLHLEGDNTPVTGILTQPAERPMKESVTRCPRTGS